MFFYKLERKYFDRMVGPYGIFKYVGMDVNKIFVENVYYDSVVLILFSIIIYLFIIKIRNFLFYFLKLF